MYMTPGCYPFPPDPTPDLLISGLPCLPVTACQVILPCHFIPSATHMPRHPAPPPKPCHQPEPRECDCWPCGGKHDGRGFVPCGGKREPCGCPCGQKMR